MSTHIATRPAGLAQGLTLALQGALPTMAVMLLTPVAPQLLAEYQHVPNADYWAPALITIPALCVAVFSIPAGFLGDRFGPRTPLIVALVIYAFAGMAPLLVSDFVPVLISRAALGACEAVIITLSAAMIVDCFDGRSRERWLAATTAVASIAAIVFAGAAGAMAAAYGWRSVTAIYGLSLILVLAMLVWTRPTVRKAGTPVAEEAAGPAPVFPWAAAVMIASAALLASLFFFSVVVHVSRPLTELGVTDPQAIGGIIAIASLGVPVGTLVFGLLGRLGATLLAAAEALLIGAGFVGMSQASAIPTFAAFAFVAMLGAGMLLPTVLTWAVGLVPAAYRGRGLGLFQSAFALGQFLGGLLVTYLALNVVDGFLPAYGALGVAALAASGVFAALASARWMRAKPA